MEHRKQNKKTNYSNHKTQRTTQTATNTNNNQPPKNKYLDAFLKCKKVWPEIFNLASPKPLCVGIRQLLIKDAKSRNIALTNSKVFDALYWLTTTAQYKKAIVTSVWRYDANLKPVSKISAEEKKHAQLHLNNCDKKALFLAQKATNIKKPKTTTKHNKSTATTTTKIKTKSSAKPVIAFKPRSKLAINKPRTTEQQTPQTLSANN